MTVRPGAGDNITDMTTTLAEEPTRPAAIEPPSLEQASYGDRVFRGLLTVGALTIPVLLGFLVYELYMGSRLAIAKFGLTFVTSSRWDPVAEEFGAFPLVFGTLISSLVALAIAVPLSLGVAIYLTEFAPKRIRQPVAFLIGLLAAIPSVVYGLWGIFVLVPILGPASSPCSATCSASFPSSRVRSTARPCCPPASSWRSWSCRTSCRCRARS